MHVQHRPRMTLLPPLCSSFFPAGLPSPASLTTCSFGCVYRGVIHSFRCDVPPRPRQLFLRADVMRRGRFSDYNMPCQCHINNTKSCESQYYESCAALLRCTPHRDCLHYPSARSTINEIYMTCETPRPGWPCFRVPSPASLGTPAGVHCAHPAARGPRATGKAKLVVF